MKMLTNYLSKPVHNRERILIIPLTALLVTAFLIDGEFTYFGVDACYSGLYADLSNWYTRDCETGLHINRTIGWISQILTLSISLAAFKLKNSLIRVTAITALLLKSFHLLITYVYYSYIKDGFHHDVFSHLPFLLMLSTSIYLLTTIVRTHTNR